MEMMKRREMLCKDCISYHEGSCRLNPKPEPVEPLHWCGHGEWHQWNEIYSDWISYKWGEWEWPTER